MARELSVIMDEQNKLLEKQKNASKATANELYDSKAQTIKDTYTQQITDSEGDYEDAYRENAVQKKVNEFYIAEEMANMGLTDSGMNRTQITANQLSYANRKAEIDQKRQSMVDALAREMAARQVDVENERKSTLQGIDDSYTQLAAENAQKIYSSEVDADAALAKERIAAEQKASYIIQQNDATLSKSMQGSFEANGISVKEEYDDLGEIKGYTYVDNNSGKKTYFKTGVNPFTGTTNKDVKNGAFSNGYQPNNINGTKLSKVTGAVINVNGNEQSVWKAGGEYYYWDGRANEYKALNTGEKLAVGILRGRR